MFFQYLLQNELKGLGILTVVFAHFAYMKVTNAEFLFPLSIIAGVGVDLFLFMSGFGLTVGMLKRPMKAVDFYKKKSYKNLYSILDCFNYYVYRRCSIYG